MNELSCAVARDLLPLYADGAVSEETKAVLEAHLEGCPACREELESLRTPLPIPAETEAEPLRKIKRNLRRRRRRAVLLTAAVTALALLALFAAAYAPAIFQRGNPLPYLAAAARLSGQQSFVLVEQNEREAVYISKLGADPVYLTVAWEGDLKGMQFREQMGAAYLFSDGERSVAVQSEVYWGRWMVWEVPRG